LVRKTNRCVGMVETTSSSPDSSMFNRASFCKPIHR
jgi:hypothetical protein